MCLDVGTNNPKLVGDPNYFGTREPRLAGAEYYDMVGAPTTRPPQKTNYQTLYFYMHISKLPRRCMLSVSFSLSLSHSLSLAPSLSLSLLDGKGEIIPVLVGERQLVA